MDEAVRDKHRDWEAQVLRKLTSAHPERKKEFKNTSDIEMETLYIPRETDYLEKLGFPGLYPFTRGVQPNMYRGKLWTMREYAGFATAEDTNKRNKFLLQQGVTGLSVAFDLPTQIGNDSDDPLSFGEVGKVGVAIDSLKDMEILFDGLPLDKVSTSMTINAPAGVLLAMYVAVAEKQHAPLSALSGTIQNDILKEYVSRGTYIFPPGPSMRLICDIFHYASEHLPEFNPISISGYHMREAGSSAVQEIAFTLANAIGYVQAAVDSGLDVDAFARRLSFFFAVHNHFLEEIAKFRAARRIWAGIMKKRFGARDPRSMMLRFHTQTGGSTLTAQQPRNNIIRVTLQALAAVLGGTQSLHTNSFDEALELPTEESVRIALRTQQIIAEESGVTDTVDPLAGSYCLESLTDEMEERALEYIRKIDELGGAVKAVETGYYSREITKSAFRIQKDIDEKRRPIVGVNCCRMDEKPFDSQAVSDAGERLQLEKLKKLKEDRDGDKVKKALSALQEKAKTADNLMPAMVEAVKAYATLGEICHVLREVFGEYKPGESIF